jgi:hypothetical protein
MHTPVAKAFLCPASLCVHRPFPTFKPSNLQTACPERSEGFKRLPIFNRDHLFLELFLKRKTVEIANNFQLTQTTALQ